MASQYLTLCSRVRGSLQQYRRPLDTRYSQHGSSTTEGSHDLQRMTRRTIAWSMCVCTGRQKVMNVFSSMYEAPA